LPQQAKLKRAFEPGEKTTQLQMTYRKTMETISERGVRKQQSSGRLELA